MNTITLELLRTGGPENQLISVLTPYLAVCGNHEPRIVHLPFNHHEYLLRQKRLRYGLEEQTAVTSSEREAELMEIGRALSGILGSVPGLMASFGSKGDNELVHLELVFSALELALLPFEAVVSPDGCPGSGQLLSMQLERPVTITRRLRGALDPKMQWRRPVKILVAVSNAGGAVPAEEHVAAVRRAVEPLVVTSDDREAPDDLVHVLPNASLTSIQRACSENDYSFVHLLAHGAKVGAVGGDRFGVVLHDRAGGAEIVDGLRLTSALRAHMAQGGGLARPLCVSMAVCDSGNVGGVVPPGGSLLHELHQAGIPLVVGSQFPLSTEGSTVLVDVLYGRLVRGDDPRRILHDLRQQLMLLRNTHDWASLVAYLGSWPDMDLQFWRQRVEQARRSGRAAGTALVRSDRFTESLDSRVTHALAWLQDALPASNGATTLLEDAARMEILGLRAMLFRRQADLTARLRQVEGQADARRADSRDQERNFLAMASREYREGASVGIYGTVVEDWGPLHWLATQHCLLTLVLGGRIEERWFGVAEHSAKTDLLSGKVTLESWAHATLIELAVLSAFSDEEQRRESAKDEAILRARKFLDGLVATSFQVLSTRRQIERYPHLFDDYLPGHRRIGAAKEVVDAVLAVFNGREECV